MLVSTVTPITSGRGTLAWAAAATAESAAARIIALPPEQWTLTIHAPVATAEATAPATVLGMSWNLRSRNTLSPRSASVRTIAGPSAVNSCLPILKPPTAPRSWSASASARSAVGHVERDEDRVHAWAAARRLVSTAPTRSWSRAIRWRRM